jgi:hypothetical protein
MTKLNEVGIRNVLKRDIAVFHADPAAVDQLLTVLVNALGAELCLAAGSSGGCQPASFSSPPPGINGANGPNGRRWKNIDLWPQWPPMKNFPWPRILGFIIAPTPICVL